MVLMRGVSDAEKLGQLFPLSLGGHVVCFSFLSCLGYHLKVHYRLRDVFLELIILIDSFLQETKNHGQQSSIYNDKS